MMKIAKDMWNEIPDEILLHVFGFLKEADLVTASCACRRWRRVYNDASLWRYRAFELSGYYRSQADRLQHRLSGYVSTMGCHLQHLQLSCFSPNLITAYGVAQGVRTLLLGLTNLPNGRATLKTFTMRHVNFDEAWDSFRASKDSLVASLTHFLQAQGALRIVDLEDAFMTPPFSYRVLHSLSNSRSRSSLVSLNIINYFCCDTPSRFVGSMLKTVARRCWHLQEITMNYLYLHAAGVAVLCEELAESLRLLRLHIDVLDQARTEVIPSSKWSTARAACPRLRVAIHIHCWPREPWSVIVASLPLSELVVRGRQCWRSEVSVGAKLSRVMDCLSHFCPQTLERATFSAVGVPKLCPPTQSSLARFLLKCTRLRKLVFSDSLMTPAIMVKAKKELANSTASKLVTVVKV